MELTKEIKQYKRRLEHLKEEARQKEIKQAKAEAALEQLRLQEDELMNSLKELGYNSPEEGHQAIEVLLKKLNETLNHLEGLSNDQPLGSKELFSDTEELPAEIDFEMDEAYDYEI